MQARCQRSKRARDKVERESAAKAESEARESARASDARRDAEFSRLNLTLLGLAASLAGAETPAEAARISARMADHGARLAFPLPSGARQATDAFPSLNTA
jgi:hypothetical protein